MEPFTWRVDYLLYHGGPYYIHGRLLRLNIDLILFTHLHCAGKRQAPQQLLFYQLVELVTVVLESGVELKIYKNVFVLGLNSIYAGILVYRGAS